MGIRHAKRSPGFGSEPGRISDADWDADHLAPPRSVLWGNPLPYDWNDVPASGVVEALPTIPGAFRFQLDMSNVSQARLVHTAESFAAMAAAERPVEPASEFRCEA